MLLSEFMMHVAGGGIKQGEGVLVLGSHSHVENISKDAVSV